MGRVKEWAMEEQFCIVCGQGFWPFESMNEGHSEIDLGAPTCSKTCYNEYCGVMEAIADMQEEYCPHCEQKKIS